MSTGSDQTQHGVHALLPGWLTAYDKASLKSDLIGGVTAAAVVIPMAMAYAAIAGLPLQVGLYTALVPLVIYAVLGTSRPLSVSTTSTISILVGTQLAHLGGAGEAAHLNGVLSMLTLMVGGILVAASLLRFGFVANFISHPVLTGFKAGVGLVIVLDQLPKVLGLHLQKGTFLHNLGALVENIPHASVPALAVGLVTIALLLGIERMLPRGPAPLVAVAAGIGAMALLGLRADGVATVGHIPEGLPVITLPDLSMFEHLWAGALGIALMSFTESIAAGRAFANNDEPTPAANRELFATGLANAGCALLGGMPAGGGTSQTAVNRLAGARTQVASLVTAGITLVTMFVLAPLLELMPEATLAGLVLLYAAGLIRPAEFRAILNVRRTEFVWALAALAGVVLLGTLHGILVAIIVSLVALAFQVADPPVYELARKRDTNFFRPLSPEYARDETFEGLLMVRPEGRIFFANAERIADKLRELIKLRNPRVVALDLSGVFDLEYTALRMLMDGERKLRESGISMWLVGMSPEVLAMIRHSALGATLGRERMVFDLELAVTRYHALARASAGAVVATKLT